MLGNESNTTGSNADRIRAARRPCNARRCELRGQFQGCRADSLNRPVDERSEPQRQMGLAPLFHALIPLVKGAGFYNYARGRGLGGLAAGSGRPKKPRLQPPIPVG